MHGIAGRRDEIEAFVEGPRLIILGVDGEGPKAGNLGRRKRSLNRIVANQSAIMLRHGAP